MDPAVEIKNVSKRYDIAAARGYYYGVSRRLGETVSETFRHPVRSIKGIRQNKETFWALKDVTFNVEKGESLGIIGRNGAGKSTLLKILSQITYPTEGEVVMRGRVGSLLEVGTGFHPELTGRENIYLNGAILGMGRKEIDAKFDRIVKFADVEKFLDTPTKRYSSGMYLRLAFAVAAHLEPDVLIADEVLAVGDQQFQDKCLGKMKEVAQEGRTVLFVSHNMHAIRQLCDTGVLLKAGQVVAMGPVEGVINQYAQSLDVEDDKFPVVTKDIVIDDLEVRQRGIDTGLIDGTAPFEIVIHFQLPQSIERLRMGVYIHTALGDELARSFFSDWDPKLEHLSAGAYEARLSFPQKLLVPGNYTITLGARRQGTVDILHGHHIDRGINVSAPLDLNVFGGEPLQAQILVDRRWEVNRVC